MGAAMARQTWIDGEAARDQVEARPAAGRAPAVAPTTRCSHCGPCAPARAACARRGRPRRWSAEWRWSKTCTRRAPGPGDEVGRLGVVDGDELVAIEVVDDRGGMIGQFEPAVIEAKSAAPRAAIDGDHARIGDARRDRAIGDAGLGDRLDARVERVVHPRFDGGRGEGGGGGGAMILRAEWWEAR